MKPVKINAFDVISRAAEAIIPFGVIGKRSADGKIKPADVDSSGNVEGLVDSDMVEKDEDGFYSTYDIVAVITKGRGRAWIVSDVDASEDLVSGDFLEIAALGDGLAATRHGLLQEAGAKLGEVRTDLSIARLTQDLTQGDTLFKHPVAVTANDTTIEFSAADLVLLDLAVGDYILLQDLDGGIQLNRVKSIVSTTVIELQIAASLALTTSDWVHKLQQAEVLLE